MQPTWGKARALPCLESFRKFAQTIQHPREGRSQGAVSARTGVRVTAGVAEDPAAQAGAWSGPVGRLAGRRPSTARRGEHCKGRRGVLFSREWALALLGVLHGGAGSSEPKAPGEGMRALTPPDGEEEAPGGLPGRCRVGASSHALPRTVCGAPAPARTKEGDQGRSVWPWCKMQTQGPCIQTH